MDIGSLKAEEFGTLELVHPVDKTPLGIFIEVFGQDSKVYKDFTRKNQNQRLKKMKRGSNSSSAEKMDSEGLDLLSICTKNWYTVTKEEGLPESRSDVILVSGKEVEFSETNARSLFDNFAWIREQVDVGIVDRGLFIKG